MKEEIVLNIGDLKPGMSHVDIDVNVVEISERKQITMSGNVKREILELKVEDKTGLITLVLWDDKIIHDLRVGDILQIRNGFVTSYRGEWRVNVGKYGEVRRLDQRK